MARKVRETAGITWFAGFCSRYDISSDKAMPMWQEMLDYFNPETVYADASAVAQMLRDIADGLQSMDPGAELPDIATLITKHGMDPSVRSTQHAVRSFIKANDMLEHVPASRERYVRRLTHGKAISNGGAAAHDDSGGDN